LKVESVSGTGVPKKFFCHKDQAPNDVRTMGKVPVIRMNCIPMGGKDMEVEGIDDLVPVTAGAQEE
jgi:hypothetical protein